MKGPNFEGLVSPSVRKMDAMLPDELREHLKRLEQERSLLTARLEQVRPNESAQSRQQWTALEKRLRSLIQKGEELLTWKDKRR